MRKPVIGVVSLGCPKNTTDTEVMLGLLNEAGFEITFDNDTADMCLVNTCAFVEDARKESVKTIVELADEGKELIITGCLAQHYKDELLGEIPEARALVGTGDIKSIVEVVKAVSEDSSLRVVQVSDIPNDYHEDVLPRFQTGYGASAYLKIAEGCDHTCSFCIIPQLRGKFRSRSIESIVAEARQLVASGVQEIILISQDSTYYGLDIYKRMALDELLEALHEIEDLKWIRVMYFYPTETQEKLLKTMARLPKVAKYVDIPLQHSHPEVLKAMARPIKPEETVKLVRKHLPEAAVRTTFIVGFPGETEEQFEHLCNFIKEQKFDRLGVFAYSKQMEVPSGHMDGQVPEKVKKVRRRKLMEIQHQISLERNESLLGKLITVLVEGFDEKKKLYFGRSQWDAPSIDNQVYIKATGHEEVIIGDFVRAKVVEAKPYDLIAVAMPELSESDTVPDVLSELKQQKKVIGVH
jgi:ribosomal protein S12 methylthiotransferase